MNTFCFGLSHRTAAVDTRERFAIPESALPEALTRLKTMPGLIEGLIVSTCGRTEFYVPESFGTAQLGIFFDSFYRNCRVGDERQLFYLWANRCVHHLLINFWSGLDGSWRNGNLWPGLACLRVCGRSKDDRQTPESTLSKIVLSQ